MTADRDRLVDGQSVADRHAFVSARVVSRRSDAVWPRRGGEPTRWAILELGSESWVCEVVWRSRAERSGSTTSGPITFWRRLRTRWMWRAFFCFRCSGQSRLRSSDSLGSRSEFNALRSRFRSTGSARPGVPSSAASSESETSETESLLLWLKSAGRSARSVVGQGVRPRFADRPYVNGAASRRRRRLRMRKLGDGCVTRIATGPWQSDSLESATTAPLPSQSRGVRF